MDSDTEKYQAAFTGLAKARRRVVTAVAMIPIATTLLVLAFLKIPALSVIGLVLALYGVFAWDAAHNRLTAVLCPRCDAPFVADNAHARELLLGARKCSHCQLSFGAAPEKTGYRHAHRPAPTLDSVAESAMQERWGGLRSWWYRPALLLAAHATLWVGIALWDSAALFALALFGVAAGVVAFHLLDESLTRVGGVS